jgi:YHS domain-containing protein
MMKLASLLVLLWSATTFADVPLQQDRNEAEYNPQFSVGLNGYDPVSYFTEGGGSPLQGAAQISFTYGTITYYFSSKNNLELFKTNPLKYEPTYGGWCAYAMSEGAKVTINPTVFTIHGNRSHFFVNKSAKKSFDKDVVGRESEADLNWKDFSGEAPRL